MNGYELNRKWFNFSFNNKEAKPIHTAVYIYAIEHCNKLGWKKEFGFPTDLVMEILSIKSYNTYSKTLNELVDFGFINMVEKSKNQWTTNIIALSKFNESDNKALEKATLKHLSKQCESTIQSIDSINKLLNKETIELLNKETKVVCDFLNSNLDLIFKNQKLKNLEGDFSEVESAYNFLKKQIPSAIEDFEMQNKKRIKDYEKFVNIFNSKVIQEEKEFKPKILKARLDQQLVNWKFDKKTKPNQDENYNGNR